MNKLIKQSIPIIIAFSLLSQPILVCGDNMTKTITIEEAFARYDDEKKIKIAKAAMDYYLNNNKYDFLGNEGEELYFYLQKLYSKNNPIKEIEFDIKNIGMQVKLTEKAIKDNDTLYMSLMMILAGARYLKLSNIKKAQLEQRMLKHYNKLLKEGNIFEIVNYECKMNKMLGKNNVLVSAKTKKEMSNIFIKCLKILFK